MSKSMKRTKIEIINLIGTEINILIIESAFQAFHTYNNLTGALSIK